MQMQTAVRPESLQDLQQRVAHAEQLKQIINQIHSAKDLDQILINLKDEILQALDAERLTLYAVDAERKEIFSRFVDVDKVKEIRVPIAEPSAFAAGPKIGSEPGISGDAKLPVAFILAGGGWIRSSRTRFGLDEISGDVVDFEDAEAGIPGPGGNWILAGRLVLKKTQGMIMARNAVLKDSSGKTVAEADSLMVPISKPESFVLR